MHAVSLDFCTPKFAEDLKWHRNQSEVVEINARDSPEQHSSTTSKRAQTCRNHRHPLQLNFTYQT